MVNERLNQIKRILVSGIPRSGSTWLARALAAGNSTKYIHEPDNEKSNLLIYSLKQNLHRFPYLRSSQSIESYEHLWELAFNGVDLNKRLFNIIFGGDVKALESGIKSKSGVHSRDCFGKSEGGLIGEIGHRFQKIAANRFAYSTFLRKVGRVNSNKIIVKSVHNLLALKWIEQRFDVDIVVIVRHPANIIASYLRLQMPDALRNIYSQKELIDDYLSPFVAKIDNTTSRISKMATQIGAFYYVLENMITDFSWILVRHEDLCKSPKKSFKSLYSQLDLQWTEKVTDFIEEHDKSGEGFGINRVAKDQVEKYKRELESKEIRKIRTSYEVFGNRLYFENW